MTKTAREPQGGKQDRAAMAGSTVIMDLAVWNNPFIRRVDAGH